MCRCAATGLLLSCSRSTSLDSAFLQRRAPLPIIETQKSPWNVSNRFVSRKNNEVTVWMMEILFFQPFHPQQVFFTIEVFTMDRFVRKRSSSSLNLDASSLDGVRAERAAIACLLV